MTTNYLADLFHRDLSRLTQEVQAFPSDEMPWQIVPGITNSAGNLVLHLEGNLREYIGRQLGGVPYTRNRPLEFTATRLRRDELVGRIEALKDSIPSIIRSLSSEKLEAEYPELILQKPLSTQAVLLRLYGHLNWHLGQVDYLRRALSGSGAIQFAER